MWDKCLKVLEDSLPQDQFNTWISPLQALEEANALILFVPNQMMLDRIKIEHLEQIKTIIKNTSSTPDKPVRLQIGSRSEVSAGNSVGIRSPLSRNEETPVVNNLSKVHFFDNFVKGKANQLACAAAKQVAENIGQSYNPFFIYGGVGLGKTHLMHAIGNHALQNNPAARVVYLRSEHFVGDMVKALQHNQIDRFKKYYRSLDILLIDDIQFFAKKEFSQEEFFHTFNALLEGNKQVVMTSDRYPKEVEGLEERLKSRFSSGLTVAVEPPELEMRVAILMQKSSEIKLDISDEVAFFMGQRIQSHVRDLEGALKRVAAHASFTGNLITVDFVKEALRDILAAHDRAVTLDMVKKTVAEYYKIRVSDLLSKSRSRAITRPRQMAMSLAKKLTNHSLPEIGDSFGGRDHSTVIHACNKVKELCDSDASFNEDHRNLVRILSV